MSYFAYSKRLHQLSGIFPLDSERRLFVVELVGKALSGASSLTNEQKETLALYNARLQAWMDAQHDSPATPSDDALAAAFADPSADAIDTLNCALVMLAKKQTVQADSKSRDAFIEDPAAAAALFGHLNQVVERFGLSGTHQKFV